MNWRRLRIGLFLGLLTACAGAWADVPRVEVSIKPVHALVARLMAGIGEPGLLVDGSPYGHALTDAERTRVEAADLLVWVGPELEPFLIEPRRARAGKPTLTLLDSDALKVLPSRSDESRRDPFFWLDSRNALILVELLADELVALDPASAGRYRRNQADATAEIDAIDREFEFRYRDVSVAPIVLYHDTLQYFEQAYAASVAAIVADSPGSEPSAGRLLDARSRLGGRIQCLFTEAGLPSPHLPLITGSTGVRVAELDSLGVSLAPGPDAYLQLMRRNFDTLHRCVAPESASARAAGHFAEGDGAPAGRLSGRFMLVNHHGQPVADEDFIGRFRVVSFGYTGCPDVCPTTLAVLGAALRELGDERSARIQALFISVDPERDTPEVLNSYVNFFHPQIIGLTGPKAMVDSAVRDFGVRYEYVPDGSGGYAVNHTAGYFLFGPDGRFLDKVAHGITGPELAKRLAEYLR